MKDTMDSVFHAEVEEAWKRQNLYSGGYSGGLTMLNNQQLDESSSCASCPFGSNRGKDPNKPV